MCICFFSPFLISLSPLPFFPSPFSSLLYCSLLMESWRYAVEGKGFLFSDEIDLSIDSFGRSRRLLTGWDGDSVESTEFIDLGFSETPKIRGFGSCEVDIDTSKMELASPGFMIASNSSLESGLNHSNSLLEGLEASSHDSSLIDLKLGRLADGKNTLNTANSSLKAASQSKRARAVSSRVQTPYCQVYGCHKDLSALKDYHKRHKVCEAHSKTPRVIVNGLEQRFCQQCSRFHLLVEFDESKRSCRKRLAGHNERRRKPQFGGPSGRPNRLLQSYQGSKFFDSSIPKKGSIIFPNILPGTILYPEKCEQTNFSRPVKLEEKSVYFADTQLLPKSFLHLHGNDIHSTSGNFPPATEDFSVLNASTSVHNLAGLSHSSCALSLLSAESPDLSHSMMARPFTSQSTGFPDKFVNAFHSPEMSPFKVNHIGPFVEHGGFLRDHEANFLNSKYCVSSEDGSTVNLLQLSSHLHRVEQQRNSAQVKYEIEEFSSFLPT